MAVAPRAQAYSVEPVVEQNVGTITEHVARGGAISVPGVDCGATCADWWLEEHRPIPGQPSSEELWRELRNVRTTTQVLPALRVLGTVGLAATAFELGWKIGTGINAKFLTLGFDASPPEDPFANGAWLHFTAAGTALTQFAFGTTTTTMPEDGFLLYGYADNRYAFFWPDDQAGCDVPIATPSGMTEITGGSNGCYIYPTVHPGTYHGFYLPEAKVRAAAPVEDYTGQPSDRTTTSWSDAPTSQTQLQARVRDGLESGEVPLAEAWYAHQLEPQTYDDPTEDEEQLRDCRPDDEQPLGDPAPERGTQDYLQGLDRWWARYDTVPESAFPPGSAVPEEGLPATGGRAYMRWGWASLNAEKPEIDWEGWGYRKIVAKHGWGPTALGRTEEALLSAPLDTGRYDQYVSPTTYAGRSGKSCEWIVIVQRDPNETSANPEWRSRRQWAPSSPRMDAGFDKADLERCRDYVREELRTLASAFERAGLRVTGVEVDEDNDRPFPDLVVFLVSDYVEGERELRHYLGTTGVLLDGSEVARDIYIWSTEVSGAAGVERLRRSRRTLT